MAQLFIPMHELTGALTQGADSTFDAQLRPWVLILIVGIESTVMPTSFLHFAGLRVAFSGLLGWRIR